jgi:hypothetical protein
MKTKIEGLSLEAAMVVLEEMFPDAPQQHLEVIVSYMGDEIETATIKLIEQGINIAEDDKYEYYLSEDRMFVAAVDKDGSVADLRFLTGNQIAALRTKLIEKIADDLESKSLKVEVKIIEKSIENAEKELAALTKMLVDYYSQLHKKQKELNAAEKETQTLYSIMFEDELEECDCDDCDCE